MIINTYRIRSSILQKLILINHNIEAERHENSQDHCHDIASSKNEATSPYEAVFCAGVAATKPLGADGNVYIFQVVLTLQYIEMRISYHSKFNSYYNFS